MSKAAELAALIGSQSALSNRNMIINGGFQCWQRATSATTITSNGYHTTDRWNVNYGSTGLSHTQEQSSDTPTGFGYSLKVTATTQYSLGAADSYELDHRFEGQNLQQIKKGTSDAESVTLSFWVKSSLTGTFICAFNDLDTSGQRMVSGSYTISSANTWEYKTITFPPDTTGAFNNDNGLSARIIFCLAAGSNYTSGTLATSWEASAGGANTYVGQTNLFGTLNATWQVAGIQMEIGEQATPFEHKSFGDELAACQRYYTEIQKASGQAINTSQTVLCGVFPTEMRATPTASLSAALTIWQLGIAGSKGQSSSNISVNSTINSGSVFNAECGNFSSLTLHTATAVAGGDQPLKFDAEL
jgi:hypothetical protein